MMSDRLNERAVPVVTEGMKRAATKALIVNCAGFPGDWYPVVAEAVLEAALGVGSPEPNEAAVHDFARAALAPDPWGNYVESQENAHAALSARVAELEKENERLSGVVSMAANLLALTIPSDMKGADADRVRRAYKLLDEAAPALSSDDGVEG